MFCIAPGAFFRKNTVYQVCQKSGFCGQTVKLQLKMAACCRFSCLHDFENIVVKRDTL